LINSTKELANSSGSIAIEFCKYFNFDSTFSLEYSAGSALLIKT